MCESIFCMCRLKKNRVKEFAVGDLMCGTTFVVIDARLIGPDKLFIKVNDDTFSDYVDAYDLASGKKYTLAKDIKVRLASVVEAKTGEQETDPTVFGDIDFGGKFTVPMYRTGKVFVRVPLFIDEDGDKVNAIALESGKLHFIPDLRPVEVQE